MTETTEKYSGRLRFVLQEDKRHILQQEVFIADAEGYFEAAWRNVSVVKQKDVPGYKPVKLGTLTLVKKLKKD